MPWRQPYPKKPTPPEGIRPASQTDDDYDLVADNAPSWLDCRNNTPPSQSTPLWKTNEQHSTDGPQWEALSRTFTVDNIYNPNFPEDAPFELDESYSSVLSRSDLESGDSRPGQQSQIQHEDRTPRAYHGYSSLTMSEERALRDIAMPSYVQSEDIPADAEELCDLPEPATQIRQQKRKSSMSSEADDATHLQQVRKKGHNAIEKRYRTNLNDKIFALQQCIPTMRTPSQAGQADLQANPEEGPSVDRTQKYRKAAVLVAAVDYITELGSKVEKLDEETDALKIRLAAF